MMTNTFRRLIACASLVGFALGIPAMADAAAVRTGSTITAFVGPSRGTAVGYDSVNHVYLVVSSFGVVRGRFVDAKGTPLGSVFLLQASANYTHFPHVQFSPEADGGAGAFLVTWFESDLPASNVSVHGRMVGFGRNGPYTSDRQFAADGAWWEVPGPAVAYSSASQEFLVAWRKFVPSDIRAIRVDTNGAAKGPAFSIAATADYEDNPSIGYNPITNQFLVTYAGYSNTGNFAYVDCRLVQAGTGALVGAAATRLATAVGTYITDTTYIPGKNQFLATWYHASRSETAIFGRRVAADGTAVGNVIALSTRWKANDALSIAYNRKSNTSFMVSHDPTTVEDGGVEIDSNGNPVDNGFRVTALGGKGNFYPRIAASEDEPNWLVSAAASFTSTAVQLVSSTVDPNAPAAPGSPSPSPSPAPGAPNPKMNVDYPGANAQVAGNAFLVSGWALDQGASAGTGVDAIDVWAYPAGSSTATLVGSATYGIARADVAGFVGAPFTNCGFTLVGSIPTPGAYDLYVYAHSTVTGTWNNVKIVRVTVQAPASNPKMWLDSPGVNQTTSQNLTVAGWAIDLGAANGTGVDTVHVWAYPTSGAAAVLVGAATYGTSRGDIASFAGATRFAPSGFVVTGTLPPGDYNLVAFAHSTVTNTFNNVVQVPIKVR